jgi:Tetratricopeptide repeat
MRYRGTFADWTSDEAAYRQSMLALAQSSSSENVQLLTAETLLEDGGLAWSGGTLASDESRHGLTLVTSVLGTNPASVMANHLCIHLYDLAPDRTPALACARRLDAQTFEPEAEHLAHMPAHYWIETGHYEAALASSERAYTLLERLKVGEGGVEHTRRYAKHDVSVGYSAAMMRGSYASAQTWAGRMAAAYDLRFDALTALRFGRYADAYAAAGSQFGNPSVRGLAAISLGRLSEAHELATRVRAAANAGNGYLPQLFLARLAEADGKFDEARRWIAQAATNQRASFGGELIPFIPAQEALGGFYLRRNENVEAAAAFNAALEAYPNDPRALFGLAAALAADGKSAQAADARARFKAGWNGADTFLDGAAIE